MVVGRRAAAVIVMMMVHPALVMITGAELHITGKRIGKMNVMVRVLDAVHQCDISLPGQHDGQRHAQNGDRASQRYKASAQRRLAFGNPTRRERWQFSTVQDPGNFRAW